MNNNEKFIQNNTRTCHKRMESMVLYALHYELRDVEVLSQYHVSVGNKTYKIDAYFPAINLAVEVDEPYHNHQIEIDTFRQTQIEGFLKCKFVRVNCERSIYKQVDEIVKLVKTKIEEQGIEPWEYEPRALGVQDGQYSQKHKQSLEDAGIPEIMGVFATELESEGFVVTEGRIKGIPNPGNGELGFLVKHSCIEFAVYARASGNINVRVMSFDKSLESSILNYIKPRQVTNGKPKYYALLMNNGSFFKDKVKAKHAMYDFLDKLNNDTLIQTD